MPVGRPKDEHRNKLAASIDIPRSKTRKLSILHLEQLASLDGPERRLLSPRPRKYGRSPRYITPKHMPTTMISEFTSRKMAEAVAIFLERMTGEECTIAGFGYEFTVIRHCTGEKMEVV